MIADRWVGCIWEGVAVSVGGTRIVPPDWTCQVIGSIVVIMLSSSMRRRIGVESYAAMSML